VQGSVGKGHLPPAIDQIIAKVTLIFPAVREKQHPLTMVSAKVKLTDIGRAVGQFKTAGAVNHVIEELPFIEPPIAPLQTALAVKSAVTQFTDIDRAIDKGERSLPVDQAIFKLTIVASTISGDEASYPVPAVALQTLRRGWPGDDKHQDQDQAAAAATSASGAKNCWLTITFHESLLQTEDFRSKSRHAKNFATGIVDIPRIKF
jgi:hypothetical protein